MISKFDSIFQLLFFLWTTSCLVFRESSAQQTSDGSTNGKILGSSSFFFYQQSTYPRDCREVQEQCSSHNSSGVFEIKPDGYPEPFEVYCDNTDSSGGWTVIQRRTDGSIDFRRDWDSYKSGFGFLSHDFWLGNEKLSFLTNQKKYQLVIEITTSSGYLIRVSYDHFRISDAFSHFKLVNLGNYSGENTDAITFTPLTPAKDCQEIYDDGSRNNGIYSIKPTGWTGPAFEVYCNMTDGGGWTVFQRRVDGSQDFYIGWDSYKQGFGNLSINFWLGNDKLYYLTNQKRYEIRIDLVNRYGAPYYAKFDFFRTNDLSDNYRLSGLGTYSGTSGDALSRHRNQQFTTKDRDNDAHSSYNCASYYYYNGAWWYDDCHDSNLNGVYGAYYFYWRNLPGSYYYIKFTEMKIRPI
ncbi:fibrinogen-like protein A [Apostichopus japonicus]|uniref:fibrinogen-like protein A n=1 Tax=Stichopus japonicus TaxID=307972 RepID=UPI003AB50D7E